MFKPKLGKHLVGLPALMLVMLLLAACGAAGTPADAPADAPAVEEQATGAEEAATEEPEEGSNVSSEEDTAAVLSDSQAGRGEIAVGVAVTSTEEVESERTNRGGEFRSSTTSDFVNFHPYLTTDTASTGAQANVWDAGLLRIDENTLQYIPNMAEAYTISEDGLTFTFKLRETIEWSDGTPLTAHDFKWAYDQAIKPENEFPYLSQFEIMTSVEALDDYTLQIQIGEAYCPALGRVSGLITPLPRHIWQELDWSDPETNAEINKPTVISGPYSLLNWERDAFSEYEANENYWYHGAPNITRKITEIVPDNDVSYEKMKSGETDTGVITPDNLEEARQMENITVYEWWPAAAQWSYVGLNLRKPGGPTMDINVRHALSYAIDKDSVVEDIMEGEATRQCSIFPDTSWAYSADVPCYDYSTEQAIAEFEEAGYTYDGTTMLTPEGEPLVLKLIYGPNTSETLEKLSLLVQANLSDIGIEVEIQAMEWASFLEETDSENPDWDMFLGAWRATIEPQIMYTIWNEESIPELNSVGYINKEVDELFAEAGRNCDLDAQKEIYAEIQRTIAEESPYIFLYSGKAWAGVNNRIAGIEPTPLGITYNQLDWYVREAQQ